MGFATGPQLRYIGLGKYATTGPTLYVGSHDVITIPPDFQTDLASVPRIFWALLPPNGTYERSAVLHDFGCVSLADGSCVLSSRDVDGLFRRVAREEGVGLLTRWALWTGVRWGALFNPARRAGWIKDAPAVIGISGLTLAAVAAVALAVHVAVSALLDLI